MAMAATIIQEGSEMKNEGKADEERGGFSLEFCHVHDTREHMFTFVNIPQLCGFNFYVTKESRQRDDTEGEGPGEGDRARNGKLSRKIHSFKLDGLLLSSRSSE